MKIRQIVLAGATVMLLATGNAWADASLTGCLKSGGKAAGCSSSRSVPEIDAASGTSAIALLTGVLLLVGERSRSRRS
jgi:hypothetical protein